MTDTNRYVLDVAGSVANKQQGDLIRPIVHHIHHSPDGHSWGYFGSGPSELARDILWDHLGAEPHPACYQDMKEDLVAEVPMNQRFVLDVDRLEGWLLSWQIQNPNTPTLAADDNGCGSSDDPRWDAAAEAAWEEGNRG